MSIEAGLIITALIFTTVWHLWYRPLPEEQACRVIEDDFEIRATSKIISPVGNSERQ